MRRRGHLAAIPLLALLVIAAAGCSGPEGPVGPAGPLNDPPYLSTISPDSGSWRNFVTLRGANFSAIPAENLVYFDGSPATVLSATTTELVVIPAVAPVTVPEYVGVTVVVGKQASNFLLFQVLPSGTLLDVPSGVLSRPVSIAVAPGGRPLYIADARAGVLRVDPLYGYTSRLVLDTLPGTSSVAVHPQSGEIYVAYRVTLAGGARTRVGAIDPVTHAIRVVLDDAAIGAPVNDMAFDSRGDLYLMVGEPGGPTTIARLSTDLSLEPAWATVPGNREGMSLAMLAETLFVSTSTGSLYSAWTGLPAPATMSNLALSVPQAWLGGITADPARGTLRAIGANAILEIAMDGTVTAEAITPPPMEDDSVVSTWWMGTHDLALVDGILYFGNGSALVAERSRSLWIAAAGFGSGMVARGNDVFWTYACNDDVLARPITHLYADGHTQIVASGFCGTKPAFAFNGSMLVTNRFTNELLWVDPDKGGKTTLLGSLAGLVEPMAVVVDWHNDVDVLQAGGNVAHYDGDLLDLNWANDPGKPTTMTAWHTMVVFPTGRMVDQSKGGTAETFLSPTVTGALVDSWPGLGVLIAASPDALFRVDPKGNAEVLSAAPAGATFLSGTMIPDGSYLVQVDDGGTHLVRVIP